MLSDLIAGFFRRRGPAATVEPDGVAVRVDGDVPAALPAGKMACVFRGDTLVSVHRDQPPKTVARDQTCWLLPSDDVPVEVALELGGKTVGAQAKVRFEPDSLAELLMVRTVLFADDLVALVTSELGGLLDLLGQSGADELVGLDDEGRERLRAKLSLLIQARGFRCTALENLRLVEPVIEPAAAAATPHVSPSAGKDVSGEQVERALAEAIRAVRSDADWEALMGELEHAGLVTDEDAAAELDELGERLVDGQADAAQVARRIRAMADEAAQRVGLPQPDLRRWQGLALRLRLADASPEPAEFRADSAPQAGAVTALTPSRRPWTWWMLRRRSVDERLRQFLADVARRTRLSLEGYRRRLNDLRQAAQVRELDQRLQLIEELLATVPTLTPSYRKLRPDRQRVKELVRNVEQAVTAAEMVQALARTLMERPSGSDSWNESIAESRAALEAWTDQLRSRRAIH